MKLSAIKGKGLSFKLLSHKPLTSSVSTEVLPAGGQL